MSKSKYYANKIVRKATAYDGYLEKRNANDLDSFTGNAGNKNYTKFARDVGHQNGYSWCCTFVDAIFYYCYPEEWKEILHGNTASCSQLCRNFSRSGDFVKSARMGYPILFKETPQSDKYDMKHVGIVIGVDDKYVYTCEGNTSSDVGVVANGGSVNVKMYSKSSVKIGGYCRIPFSARIVPELPQGIVRASDNSTDVARLQQFFNYMGITDKYNHILDIDGSCGSRTVYAIKKYQSYFNLSVDGVFGKNSLNKAKMLLKYS